MLTEFLKGLRSSPGSRFLDGKPLTWGSYSRRLRDNIRPRAVLLSASVPPRRLRHETLRLPTVGTMERWLCLGGAVDDATPLEPRQALFVLRQSAGSLSFGLRNIWGLMSRNGLAPFPPRQASEQWRQIEAALRIGQLRVFERRRTLAAYSHDYPAAELESPAHPAPLPPEPISGLDAPSLTRHVALVVLDFDEDGEPVVGLPLFVDHQNIRVDEGKTDDTGRLEIKQLPPELRWSVFSVRKPEA